MTHRYFRAIAALMLVLGLGVLTPYSGAIAPVQAQSAREVQSVYRVVVVSQFPRGTARQLRAAQQQGQQQPAQPAQPQEGEDNAFSTGTGFLAAGRRFVVTNNHVVQPPEVTVNNQRIRATPQIYALLFNVNNVPREVQARLVAVLPAKDLAILEATEDLPGSALTLADYDPARDTDLEAIGFPGVADFAITRSNNRMQGISKDQLEPFKTQGRLQRVFDVTDANVTEGNRLTARLLLHTAAISPGNSGGPLFNRCGQVVGVNTFTATNRDTASTVNHSVHTREVIQFLRAQNQQPRTATSFCLLPGTVSDYFTIPSFLGLSAFLLALTAVVLAKQKPQVIQQTVSRVQNSFSKLNRPSPSGSGGSGQRPADPSPPRPQPARDPETAARDAGGGQRRAISPAGPVVRLVPSGGGAALEIALNRLTGGQAIVVGRSLELMQEQNPHDHPIVISDKTVSRRHARLTMDDRNRLLIEDLGSSAGTFKGELRIQTAAFASGEEVRFGSAAYRIALPAV